MSDSIADVLEPVPGEPPKKPKGDLGVRTVSAVVMVCLTALAFKVGGVSFQLFLIVIALGLLWEWWGLLRKIATRPLVRILLLAGGAAYISWPIWLVQRMWLGPAPNSFPKYVIAFALIAVIVVDVSAYAAGRTFGGKKIAPSVSPSKTWAGLYGGMVGAAAFAVAYWGILSGGDFPASFLVVVAICASILACIAQGGDFFESWLKRRAGVKDSGHLIPGHGGLLDRLDGHLAVISLLPVILLIGFTLAGIFRL